MGWSIVRSGERKMTGSVEFDEDAEDAEDKQYAEDEQYSTPRTNSRRRGDFASVQDNTWGDCSGTERQKVASQ